MAASQMKTEFMGNSAPSRVLFLTCFSVLIAAGVPSASAVTINRTGGADALVAAGNVNDFNFPGTPLVDYFFPPGPDSFPPAFLPGDPGDFSLGQGPDSFLYTGNTYFNYRGDPQLWIIESGAPSQPGPVSPLVPDPSSQQTAPEPQSVWLLMAGFAVMICLPLRVTTRKQRRGGGWPDWSVDPASQGGGACNQTLNTAGVGCDPLHQHGIFPRHFEG